MKNSLQSIILCVWKGRDRNENGPRGEGWGGTVETDCRFEVVASSITLA